jgi:triacylglycerol lipase
MITTVFATVHSSKLKLSRPCLKILAIAIAYTSRRCKSSGATPSEHVSPRAAGLRHPIEDEYAAIRENYSRFPAARNTLNLLLNYIGTPKFPIVLAHGLLGFDELHLAGKNFPGLHYWRGITEALRANDIEVITAHVPASASIELRAAKLSEEIYHKAGGKSVNIVASVKSCFMSH